MRNIEYVKEKYYKDDRLSKHDIMDLFCPKEIDDELTELNCKTHEGDCVDCWNLEMVNNN